MSKTNEKILVINQIINSVEQLANKEILTAKDKKNISNQIKKAVQQTKSFKFFKRFD